MTRPETLQNAPDRFRRREDGGLTVLNLFFLATIGILAGIAIDVANVVSARTQLQATADAAAHAALVEREWHTKQEATDRALAIALQNMPKERFGEVLKPQNIIFGDYDRATGTFTEDVNSRNAVLVQTERLDQNNNAISTFLLQFVGLWNWDVRTSSIFETFVPTCLLEGFVAQDVVDIQSNNSYFNGFCIHSNAYVSINNNNFFQSGTVVSMPDTSLMQVSITGNGEDKNEGLEEALHEGKWFIKILNRLDQIVVGVQDRQSRFARDYTKNFNVVNLTKNTVDPSDLTKGRIYKVSCNSKFIFNSGIYDEVVFIADCPIQFKNGAEFHSSIIITTDTSAKSMYAPNNLTLGLADNCAPGGGSQLITYGGFEVASSLELHGSQIIAAGDVTFSANANGIQGASIVSGGRIDGTSNMNFSFCGSGMEHNLLAEYFRLAG
jgi:Flp pilus assembly protein TadG